MNIYAAAAASGAPGAGAIFAAIGAVLLYFAPAITAAVRGVRNTGSVIVVNVFLGWTIIGWIVALAMALRSKDRTPATPVSG